MPADETRAGGIARSRRFFELWPTSKHVFMPDGQGPERREERDHPRGGEERRDVVGPGGEVRIVDEKPREEEEADPGTD